MGEIREPKKVTSIDKKKRIIAAGLKLFVEVGYYKTNTAEIAKEAGVSTGIVYNYFKDKKDILMYAYEIFCDKVYDDFCKSIDLVKEKCKTTENYKRGDLFKILLPVAIESHIKYKNELKAMTGMSYLDADVNKIAGECLNKIIDKMCAYATEFVGPINNIKEKGALCYQIIDYVCYQNCFNEQEGFNNDLLIDETCKLLTYLFAN